MIRCRRNRLVLSCQLAWSDLISVCLLDCNLRLVLRELVTCMEKHEFVEAHDYEYLLQSLLGRPLVRTLVEVSLYLLSTHHISLPGHALVPSYLCAL